MDALTDSLERGALALFIGGDLPQTVTGVPSRTEMARGLARRHDLEDSMSLARVAQMVGRGGWRRAFTVFLRERLDGAQPQPFHYRLAAFVRDHDIRTLVTTAYDDLLARACAAAGAPLEVVWKDSQLAVAFPDRPLLIQLYGNPIADVESLVVTEDDHLDLWRDRRREAVLDEVKRALQRNTVLFLGYDLGDPDFRLLWREVLDRAGDLHRRAFAVWPGLPEAEVAVWADRGIEMLAADPWGLTAGAAAPGAPSQPGGRTLPHSQAAEAPATSGLAPALYRRLHTTLLRCGPFRSDVDLRPLFVDSRISPWRDHVPSRDTPSARVAAVIDALLGRANADGEPALALLVRVLRDRTPPGDACHDQLDALANDVSDALIERR